MIPRYTSDTVRLMSPVDLMAYPDLRAMGHAGFSVTRSVAEASSLLSADGALPLVTAGDRGGVGPAVADALELVVGVRTLLADPGVDAAAAACLAAAVAGSISRYMRKWLFDASPR